MTVMETWSGANVCYLLGTSPEVTSRRIAPLNDAENGYFYKNATSEPSGKRLVSFQLAKA